MTTASREWNYGDRVVHSKRPEWGIGVVTAAAKDQHEGQPCQRLTIRFDRAGMKTLSTALAELREATEPISVQVQQVEQPAGDDEGWLARVAAAKGSSGNGGGGGGASGLAGAANATAIKERMTRLPENCIDPFLGAGARLRNTLAIYRFTDHGASLLDWAAAQSGLKDPLSQFNRHELEQLFHRFMFVRDEHLKKLVLDMKKKDPAEVGAAVRTAPPAAQQALKRLDLLR